LKDIFDGMSTAAGPTNQTAARLHSIGALGTLADAWMIPNQAHSSKLTRLAPLLKAMSGSSARPRGTIVSIAEARSQAKQVSSRLPARHSGPAVIVLGQWNALWEQYADICRWLNRLGITALKLSLPYHDRRAIPGHTRAGHLVGPNIGLTMQANRQAVSDVRRAARWLAAQGYGKIGVLGASIGSSVGFIALAHDPEIRAGAFLHVSTYFGGVVATGLTTMHVWEAMRGKVSAEDLQRYWAPISPQPYFHKLRGSGKKCLAIIGGNDPTFPPDYSDDFLTAMRDQAFEFEMLKMPCGHYSLGEAPFKYIAGFRFGTFLFETLA
jgi:hypothetical protein